MKRVLHRLHTTGDFLQVESLISTPVVLPRYLLLQRIVGKRSLNHAGTRADVVQHPSVFGKLHFPYSVLDHTVSGVLYSRVV